MLVQKLHHVASDKNFLDFGDPHCALAACRVHLEHERRGKRLMTPRVLESVISSQATLSSKKIKEVASDEGRNRKGFEQS